MHGLDGIQTVIKAQQGSREAFAELVRAHESYLYAVAKGLLRSETDIRDAMQDSILLAYQSIERLRQPAYFKTWLIRILINECRRIGKHNKRNVPIEPKDMDVRISSGMESDLELLDFLDGLDNDLKEVIVLYYVNDMSVKEVCEILNLSQSNVKSKLHRARLKLSVMLKQTEPREVSVQ
jgi:RNA polymerase sigma-70 factor (ECF subfamily)